MFIFLSLNRRGSFEITIDDAILPGRRRNFVRLFTDFIYIYIYRYLWIELITGSINYYLRLKATNTP